MRLNWNAIAQTIVGTLLLAILAGVWQTYQQAQQIPQLRAELEKTSKALDGQGDELTAKLEAQAEKIAELRTALAVLDARSQREGAVHGRHYAPAEQP